MDGIIAYALCKRYTDSKVSSIASVFNYKGAVNTYSELPTSGNKQGDVWAVKDTGNIYVWMDGKGWDLLGTSIGAGKFSTTIVGDGTTTQFAIQHNLTTKDCAVLVYGEDNKDVKFSVTRTSASEIKLDFDTAPENGKSYTVTCMVSQGPQGVKGDPGNLQDFKVDGTSVVDSQGVGNFSTSNLVHYNAETKTESEKEQARTNIGAASITALSNETTARQLADNLLNDELEQKQNKLTAGSNISIVNNTISASVPTKTSQLENDSGFLTQHQDISGKQDKLTAGTNITIDENNVISATGGAVVSFDDKTVIKGTDNKYQTAIGGWKETTPEQFTELFIDTKGNGLHTYIGPGTAAYEVGWDYNTTITSLVSGASEVVVNVKFTVLGTAFNNKITLYKQSSFPISWESNEIIINDAYYKVKVHDQYIGINNGGICVVAVDTGADLEGSTMQSCALITGPGSVIYHPIDNKFLNLDNSLSVDEDNKLKVNTDVIQSKLTAGSNISIVDNVISAADQTSKMGRAFTTNVTVGNLTAGTAISANDTVADILYKILYGSGPITSVDLYYGALDNIPAGTSGLTKESKGSGSVVGTFQFHVVAGNVELEEGQYVVFGIPNNYVISKWYVPGFEVDIPHTLVTAGNYNLYYLNNKAYDEPEGADYIVVIEEA